MSQRGIALIMATVLVCSAPPAWAFAFGRHDTVSRGEAAFRQGDYQSALTYYQLYLNSRAIPKRAKDLELATVRSGECLFYIGDVQKALGSFRDYLERYSEGKYYNTVRAVLELVQDQQRQEAAAEETYLAAVRERIATVLVAAGDSPTLGQRASLMDLYWVAGDYRRALAEYEAIIRANARFFEQNRAEYIVPEVVAASVPGLSSEIVVTGIRKSINYNQNYLGNRRILVVTATVENRSKRAFAFAEFDVTVYDFFGQMMDTQPVRVGPLPKGAKRSMTVRFDSFDDHFNNVYNVGRVVFQLADASARETAVTP